MHSHLQGRDFLWGLSLCVHCSPGYASGGPDIGVFDKHSSTIIILVQWSWTELSQHPRRDLNSRCAFVYALSPNFSGKLVVTAVLQSELSLMLSLLITWGWLQRLVCDTTALAHKFWVRRRAEAPRRRMLMDDMLAPSTITLSHCCCNVWNYLQDHSLSGPGDYSASVYNALKWHSGRVSDVCDL